LESGGVVPRTLNLSTRWRWVSGWARQPVWTRYRKKSHAQPPPRIKPRSCDRPARNQSLYWLSYPDSSVYRVQGTWTLIDSTSVNYEPQEPGIDSLGGRNFYINHHVKLALGSTQSPVLWVLGLFTLE